MNGQTQTHRQRTLQFLGRTLFFATLLVASLVFYYPAPVAADDPISVNTIVSSTGSQWNAPPAPENFFPTYVPPTTPSANQTTDVEFAQPRHLLALRAPGSIIGADGRTQIQDTREFPYRAIVFLQVQFDGGYYLECSGTLIGAHTVATAGHCVRDAGLGWARGARVYPALNGDTAPYEMARALEFYSVTGWIESYQPEFDYGAIQLDRDVGSETGWLGMTVLDKTELQRMTLRVTGYPADKPPKTMWTMTGQARRITTLRLFYDMDTYAGQSGSPVYNAAPARACSYCVVAIHGYGVGGDLRGKYNSGVRITSPVLDNFVAWRKLP